METLYTFVHSLAVFAARRGWNGLSRRLFILSDDLADRLDA